MMRYTKDHKAATRRRIVDTAGRMFRRQGIGASGVAAMMAEAGLTPGGLYVHFPSKEALVAEFLDEAITKNNAAVSEVIETAVQSGEPPLERVIDVYLSDFHFDSVEISCALASLGSEIRQQSVEAKATANRRFEELVSIIADALPPKERYKAGPLYGMLAATLQMAWLASTREEQLQRLDDGKRAARALVGIPG